MYVLLLVQFSKYECSSDYRRWVQAAFCFGGANGLCNQQIGIMTDLPTDECSKTRTDTSNDPEDGSEIDMSEGVAVEMFGISSSSDEVMF